MLNMVSYHFKLFYHLAWCIHPYKGCTCSHWLKLLDHELCSITRKAGSLKSPYDPQWVTATLSLDHEQAGIITDFRATLQKVNKNKNPLACNNRFTFAISVENWNAKFHKRQMSNTYFIYCLIREKTAEAKHFYPKPNIHVPMPFK